ncbi:Uncharacterised protein [Bordetella hinzii]|nr:Uncharacterised protein [Bordetella hinzii]
MPVRCRRLARKAQAGESGGVLSHGNAPRVSAWNHSFYTGPDTLPRRRPISARARCDPGRLPMRATDGQDGAPGMMPSLRSTMEPS